MGPTFSVNRVVAVVVRVDGAGAGVGAVAVVSLTHVFVALTSRFFVGSALSLPLPV